VEYPVLATEIVVYLTPIMQAELDALQGDDENAVARVIASHVWDDAAATIPTFDAEHVFDELDLPQVKALTARLLDISGMTEAAEAAARFQDGEGEAGSTEALANGREVRSSSASTP